MTSVAAQHQSLARELAVETADRQITFARQMAKKARREAAVCSLLGAIDVAAAYRDMADAFEANEVAWVNVRNRWVR